MANDARLKEACREYLCFLENDAFNRHRSLVITDDTNTKEEVQKAERKMLEVAMLWAQQEAIENVEVVKGLAKKNVP